MKNITAMLVAPAMLRLLIGISVPVLMSSIAVAQSQNPTAPTSLTTLAPSVSNVQPAQPSEARSAGRADTDIVTSAPISGSTGATDLTLAPDELGPDNLTAQPQPVDDSLAQTETENTSSDARREAAPALNRIGRRSVSRVGLATIGLPVQEGQPQALNSMIWSLSDADDTLVLLEQAPRRFSSPTLRALTHMVITQAAVPPKHADKMTGKLVSARLNWLAGSGQSDSLSLLTRKLPDDDKWAQWKQWQVDYDLIRRSDDTACSEAIRTAQQSLDPYWQKAKIVCHILAGDNMQAGFASDILRDILSAGNDDDMNFFTLVNFLLGRSEKQEPDLDSLDPLHLILMDAAHEQISLDAFETLPASMIQASSSFRYLAPNAALKTSFDRYVLGLSSIENTQATWQSMMSAPVAAEAALADVTISSSEAQSEARGKVAFDGLSSAYLWLALSKRSEPDTDLLIVSAVAAEVSSGRGLAMLPFYASLVRQRLNGDPQLTAESAAAYAFILTLAEPDIDLPDGLVSPDDKVFALQRILRSGLDSQINFDDIRSTEAYSILPLLSVKGVEAIEEKSWFDVMNEPASSAQPASVGRQTLQLNETALRTMEIAAEQGRVGETVLLASYLIADNDLGWINSYHMARILASLKQIGLYDAADKLADEVLVSWFLRHHFSTSPEAG